MATSDKSTLTENRNEKASPARLKTIVKSPRSTHIRDNLPPDLQARIAENHHRPSKKPPPKRTVTAGSRTSLSPSSAIRAPASVPVNPTLSPFSTPPTLSPNSTLSALSNTSTPTLSTASTPSDQESPSIEIPTRVRKKRLPRRANTQNSEKRVKKYDQPDDMASCGYQFPSPMGQRTLSTLAPLEPIIERPARSPVRSSPHHTKQSSLPVSFSDSLLSTSPKNVTSSPSKQSSLPVSFSDSQLSTSPKNVTSSPSKQSSLPVSFSDSQLSTFPKNVTSSPSSFLPQPQRARPISPEDILLDPGRGRVALLPDLPLPQRAQPILPHMQCCSPVSVAHAYEVPSYIEVFGAQVNPTQSRGHMLGLQGEFVSEVPVIQGVWNNEIPNYDYELSSEGYAPLPPHPQSYDEDSNMVTNIKLLNSTKNIQVGKIHVLVLISYANDVPYQILNPMKYLGIEVKSQNGKQILPWFRDNKDSTYSVAFCASYVGAYHVHISMCYAPLFNFSIYAVPLGDELKWQACCSTTPVVGHTFVIDLIRTDGNTIGQYPFQMGGEGKTTEYQFKDKGSNCQISFIPLESGPLKLVITLFGKHILGSPLSLIVSEPDIFSIPPSPYRVPTKSKTIQQNQDCSNILLPIGLTSPREAHEALNDLICELNLLNV